MGNKVAAGQKIYRSVYPVRLSGQDARWVARATAKTKLNPAEAGQEIKKVATEGEPAVVAELAAGSQRGQRGLRRHRRISLRFRFR